MAQFAFPVTTEHQFPLLSTENESRIFSLVLFTILDGFFIFIFGHYYPSWYLLAMTIFSFIILLCSIMAVTRKMPCLLIPNLITKTLLIICFIYLLGISIGYYREFREANSTDEHSKAAASPSHGDFSTRLVESAVQINPALPLWCIFFLIIYLVVLRLTHQIFKKLQRELRDKKIQATVVPSPPAYAVCIDPSALPTYQDAVKKLYDTRGQQKFANELPNKSAAESGNFEEIELNLTNTNGTERKSETALTDSTNHDELKTGESSNSGQPKTT